LKAKQLKCKLQGMCCAATAVCPVLYILRKIA